MYDYYEGLCQFFYPLMCKYYTKKNNVALLIMYSDSIIRRNKENAIEKTVEETYGQKIIEDPKEDQIVMKKGYEVVIILTSTGTE